MPGEESDACIAKEVLYYHPFRDEFIANASILAKKYNSKHIEEVEGSYIEVESVLQAAQKLNFTTREYFTYKGTYNNGGAIDVHAIETESREKGLNKYLNQPKNILKIRWINKILNMFRNKAIL